MKPLREFPESVTQHHANMIDMELCRLERRAEGMDGMVGDWEGLARKIRAARSIARRMMHPKRVEATQ